MAHYQWAIFRTDRRVLGGEVRAISRSSAGLTVRWTVVADRVMRFDTKAEAVAYLRRSLGRSDVRRYTVDRIGPAVTANG